MFLSSEITRPLEAALATLADQPRHKASFLRYVASLARQLGVVEAARLLRHYVEIKTSGLFDASFYRSTYPDVAAAGLDPILHYLEKGAAEGRAPNDWLDTNDFPELRRIETNPLVYYIQNKPEKAPPKHPRFETFEEYLRYCTVTPNAIKAPLDEPARRVLGVMDAYKKHLVARYRGRDQSALVSVIMPTYNRAEVITHAARSVLDQSYENLELLVVDDCGSDDTEAVLEGLCDPRVVYIRLDENRGASGARNAGLERARGAFIAYLDTDDAWDPDFLLLSVNTLRDAPGFHSIYSAQKVWLPHPDFASPGAYIRDDDVNLKQLRFASFNRSLLENDNYISMICYVHDRELLERHGPFHTSRLEDWELALRYTAESPAYALPVVLSHYQLGRADGQRSKTLKTVLADAMAQIDDTIRQNDLSDFASEYEAGRGLSLFGLSAEHVATPSERRASIVIPSWEVPEYLELCVASILEWTAPGAYELIIVDNASGPAVRQYLERLSAEHDHVRVFFNEKNLGFSYAVNRGIEAATPSNDIVILNNDTMVTPGWLSAMQEVVELVPDVGLVAPRQVLMGGVETLREHVPGCNPDRQADTSLSAHHRNILNPTFDRLRGFVELTFAPFFCVYVTRETLDVVGLLDAENGPHYRSDNLYCDAARMIAHKRIIYTPHAKVYHFHQRATVALLRGDPALYEEMKLKNDWRGVVETAPFGGTGP